MLKEYQRLLAAVQKSQPFIPAFADIRNVTKENFEIYVKRIGAFSTFLHSFQAGAASQSGKEHEFQFRGLFVCQNRRTLTQLRAQVSDSSATRPAVSWASHVGLRSPSSPTWPCI